MSDQFEGKYLREIDLGPEDVSAEDPETSLCKENGVRTESEESSVNQNVAEMPDWQRLLNHHLKVQEERQRVLAEQKELDARRLAERLEDARQFQRQLRAAYGIPEESSSEPDSPSDSL